MNSNTFLFFFFFSLICSCSSESDSEPGPPINPPPAGTTDLRSQYKVSTLTQTFNGSGGASVDANDFIYVADFGNALNNADGRQISKVDPVSGAVSVFATGFNGASGNAFDSKGNLFQSNIRGDFISVVTPEGKVSLFVDIGGNAGPVGIAIDGDDNLFVCNCNGNFISKITPSGEISTFSEDEQLSCPNGIAIDENGNLYPVNFNDGKIFKLDTGGGITLLATLPGNSGGHIEYHEGLLYAIGRAVNQIFTIDLQGNISVIAGSGARGDSDGDGETAQFFIPNGIALSVDKSKIYIVDKSFSSGGAQLNPVMVRVVEEK